MEKKVSAVVAAFFIVLGILKGVPREQRESQKRDDAGRDKLLASHCLTRYRRQYGQSHTRVIGGESRDSS